jgi:serine/threonine protein kinase/cephalosporin-C deacetylase-like acetyl esterase
MSGKAMSKDAERLEELYHQALAKPKEERAAFLAEACGGDEALHRELQSMLEALEKADGFMELPALEHAARLAGQAGSQLLAGRELGPFRIGPLLGRGGMGEVYRAVDTRLDRPVALKLLPAEVAGNPDRLHRFTREAKAASSLNHPNIATIHEIGESDSIHWIAMELVEGRTLADRIQDHRLGIDEILEVGIQTAEALEAAHKKGIIHRDIKPANLMITPEGRVKVLDFGLAKRIQLEKPGQDMLASTESYTISGLIMGTLDYMSPEQVLGQEIDQRTDLFSLGVVLYHMVAGRLPFHGASPTETMDKILHAEPEALAHFNYNVPAQLEPIIRKCLEKKREMRYRTALELCDELKEYQKSLQVSETGPLNLRGLLRRARKPRVAVSALLLFLAIGILSFWFFSHQARIRWARDELLPKIDQLVEAGWQTYIAAYKLAVEAEKLLPQESRLAEILKKIAVNISIKTDPPGARIYMKGQTAPESEWKYLGVSPIEKTRIPIGVFAWKMEKDGYETVFAVSPTINGFLNGVPYDMERILDKKGSIPIGMARVKGEKEIGDFFIDQYEVTNKQFKEFVDKGGYRKKEYWKQKFTKEGKELTWEEALKEFVDQTGQPGPATWEAGDYPEGQADYPVSGVSWYEAAAYAEFTGKSLPTVSHWGIARGEYTPLIQRPNFSSLALLSNFKGKGPAPVGSNPGMTSYGAYDIAGNVREWCWNEAPKGRIIRGGAWNDATYLFGDLSQTPPFDRSPRNGFRCALYLDPDKIPKSAFELAKVGEVPDFYKTKPVSDPVFQVYKEQFSYDKTDLNARVEWRNESSKDWIQEKITFNAAYDNERVIAYLFLPRKSLPPYQTVIYFPGGESQIRQSSKDLDQYQEFEYNLSFVIKNGRAVLFPIYKGTFERSTVTTQRTIAGPWLSRQAVEITIRIANDFKRSIDYLETRPEVDSEKLAYIGFSWGGCFGTMIPAVEGRLKASILVVGGLWSDARPEIDPISYLSRVRVPTLMLNGKYDMFFTYETKVKPMFDLLGTPKDQKVLKLYDTDHYIPRNKLIKETLAWLDRYLGPVR